MARPSPPIFFEISNLPSEIKRSVVGLFRRKTYLCAIASGDGVRPQRAQSTIPIWKTTPKTYDLNSSESTMSIKVATPNSFLSA
jgi:hypothetical protein